MSKHRVQAVMLIMLLVLSSLSITIIHGQEAGEADPRFYFGVDLSYVNEVEDCGAIYREGGEVRDPFELFADHGATLVRARLWHNPDWTEYSTLEDVKRTFTRARDQGMETLLDIHYSDNWADAGTQQIPTAWRDLDDEALEAAVEQYTTDVLMELLADDLVPAFVQVGNETNSGILKRDNNQNWTRDAALFNAGIRAVRDFSASTGHEVAVLLHVAQPENTGWWFTEAESAGVTDFDIIGVSYYPQWSTFSIADMGAHVAYLRQRFGKDVMILETAYGWTRDAVQESADNILDQGLRGYPFSPEGQHRFMTDLTQSLISNGALGVVYWEPAWVSTECHTRWGQGSHWENATFFDFQNENELLTGIDFLRDNYLHPEVFADGEVEADYGDPFIEDAAGDALSTRSALDLEDFYLRADEESVWMAVQIAGDVFDWTGSYLIYLDTTGDTQGADVDPGRRPIIVADPFKPEFRIDISIQDERGTIGGRYVLNKWVGNDWEEITFTGGAAVSNGEPSVIELQIPLALIGDPEMLNLAMVSADRGRAQGANDILGTDFTAAESEEDFVLDQFFSYEFAD